MLDVPRDFGAALSEVAERWVPDAWVICMMLTTLALALALFGAGAGLEQTVLAWGAGVWNLLELAMQFTIALVAAHACVASGPVHRIFDRLAGLPDPQKPVQAVALAGVVSLVTGYLNWAFCIILQFPFYAGIFDSCRTPRSARGSPRSSPSLPASARTRSSCTCTQDS